MNMYFFILSESPPLKKIKQNERKVLQ